MLTNYFKHLFAKHAGEVAMVTLEEWIPVFAPDDGRGWPATFFHPQFAVTSEHRERWTHRRRSATGDGSAAGDRVTQREAAEVGPTTFMEFAEEGLAATFKKAKILTLPELFLFGCEQFSALELYFYYNNCL